MVIPKTLQPKILRRLHKGNMCIEKMLRLAQSSIFWLGLTEDVTNIANNCQVFRKHAPKQSPEPILVHEPTATRSWFILGSDIFEVKYYIFTIRYNTHCKNTLSYRNIINCNNDSISKLRKILKSHNWNNILYKYDNAQTAYTNFMLLL